jgi:MYXO-CTERM domain-containing protein
MVVSKRGGCAGCAVGGDGVPNVILLAALGVLAALARRRR